MEPSDFNEMYEDEDGQVKSCHEYSSIESDDFNDNEDAWMNIISGTDWTNTKSINIWASFNAVNLLESAFPYYPLLRPFQELYQWSNSIRDNFI